MYEEIKSSLYTKISIPIKPTKTPNNCLRIKAAEKIITLINKVNRGVSETITAVTELEICVSANANR